MAIHSQNYSSMEEQNKAIEFYRVSVKKINREISRDAIFFIIAVILMAIIILPFN